MVKEDPAPVSNNEHTFEGDLCVGINQTNGVANGRLVFKGPRDGLYVLDHSGPPKADSRRVSTEVTNYRAFSKHK